MAKAETLVISVPGTNFTNPPKSINRKYPKSAKPLVNAPRKMAFRFPFQTKNAAMNVTIPIQNRLNPCCPMIAPAASEAQAKPEMIYKILS